MNNAVMLDSGPLGKIAHPHPNPAITAWLAQLLDANVAIIIPEITDYEVRRNLLLSNLTKSVARLDQLKQILIYTPITTTIMLRAAELWAEARKRGKPTADIKELDGDVILAAQALQVDAIVATENVGHLSLFVEAKHWRDITVDANN
ncbi:nuclease [candidate division KSB1 bacterium]|nr:nuclease [candidate division KSB1 bacterium]